MSTLKRCPYFQGIWMDCRSVEVGGKSLGAPHIQVTGERTRCTHGTLQRSLWQRGHRHPELWQRRKVGKWGTSGCPQGKGCPIHSPHFHSFYPIVSIWASWSWGWWRDLLLQSKVRRATPSAQRENPKPPLPLHVEQLEGTSSNKRLILWHREAGEQSNHIWVSVVARIEYSFLVPGSAPWVLCPQGTKDRSPLMAWEGSTHSVPWGDQGLITQEAPRAAAGLSADLKLYGATTSSPLSSPLCSQHHSEARRMPGQRDTTQLDRTRPEPCHIWPLWPWVSASVSLVLTCEMKIRTLHSEDSCMQDPQ